MWLIWPNSTRRSLPDGRTTSSDLGHAAVVTNQSPIPNETSDVLDGIYSVISSRYPLLISCDCCHDFSRGFSPRNSVTDEGVHINQVECLWSLLNPWLQKFRGLSKPGLELSVRTDGFVRTLNLLGAPLHGLIDCFAVTVFH